MIQYKLITDSNKQMDKTRKNDEINKNNKNKNTENRSTKDRQIKIDK